MRTISTMKNDSFLLGGLKKSQVDLAFPVGLVPPTLETMAKQICRSIIIVITVESRCDV